MNSLMNIGQSALNASQAWISVTGNNLANAETEGYSRQYVDQKDAGGLTYKPGAQPMGVNAQQIMRFFDAFLEKSYIRQNTNSSRWDQQDTIMTSLENIFNESNRNGISSSLTNFFNAWQDLALRPDDTAVRVSLLSYADNLSDMFGNSIDAIKNIQQEMNVSIRQGIKRVNDIAKTIADINTQITALTVDGVSNPNSLLDKRDQLVRELSTLVDVETIDHGKGNFRVQLSTGQPLVDGIETYSLDMLAPQQDKQLLPGSNYKGDVKFQGQDSHEYTIEIVKDGSATDTIKDDTPTFRVSLDGGKTWIKNDNGEDIHYPITQTGGVIDEVLVKNLKISFSAVDDFSKGDKFVITPKEGLYWIEPTRGPQNITPQIGFDGVDNSNRVTGGKLAAYFNIRDDNCGRYLDELDAVAKTLMWEVNRIHSQGTGLSKLNYAQGQQRVDDTTKPLGSAQSILPNYDKLQGGSVNLHFYDKDTGKYIDSGVLKFPVGVDDLNNVKYGNFDPAMHSLQDVVNAITDLQINGKTPLKASIQDDKLLINVTDQDIEFAMGADSTGLMAALGINTFFAGSGAQDISVNSQVHSNSHFVASGQVNGQHQVNVGDNATATAIGKLADKPVTVTTLWKTVDNQTISQYYANVVTTVGSDRRLSKTNTEYHGALTDDLYERVSSVTGVNMDEEMSNLIKFQHSYTAAAKLITTADQMLQTLLGLKQ